MKYKCFAETQAGELIDYTDLDTRKEAEAWVRSIRSKHPYARIVVTV